MSVDALVPLRRDPGLRRDPVRRESRDRLELLTALIDGPGFDPAFRGDVLQIPDDHPVFPWQCTVLGCQRPRWAKNDLCAVHATQWRTARAAGTTTGMNKSRFVHTAEPLELGQTLEPVRCRVCPGRPAFSRGLALCHRHRNRWRAHVSKHGGEVDFEGWLTAQRPYAGYGECRTRACDELAASPLGLCTLHLDRYRAAGRPGGASLPDKWFNTYEGCGRPTPVGFDDEAAFHHWGVRATPVMRIGQINLRGLRPLLRAEIRWGLHAHGQGDQRHPWNSRGSRAWSRSATAGA